MRMSASWKCECQCGRLIRIFTPEFREVAKAFKDASMKTGNHTDVFVCGDDEYIKCSVCGAVYRMPVAEELDPERYPHLRTLKRLINGYGDGTDKAIDDEFGKP